MQVAQSHTSIMNRVGTWLSLWVQCLPSKCIHNTICYLEMSSEEAAQMKERIF